MTLASTSMLPAGTVQISLIDDFLLLFPHTQHLPHSPATHPTSAPFENIGNLDSTKLQVVSCEHNVAHTLGRLLLLGLLGLRLCRLLLALLALAWRLRGREGALASSGPALGARDAACAAHLVGQQLQPQLPTLPTPNQHLQGTRRSAPM